MPELIGPDGYMKLGWLILFVAMAVGLLVFLVMAFGDFGAAACPN